MTDREELVKPRKHYFVPSDDDFNTCARCGKNIRNDEHCSNTERPETDAEYIDRLESALRRLASSDSGVKVGIKLDLSGGHNVVECGDTDITKPLHRKRIVITDRDASEPVKGEPEPVAWRWRDHSKGVLAPFWQYGAIEPDAYRDREVEPLFTAPPADAGMREALEPFANIANGYDDELDGDDRPVGPVQLKFCRNARAALTAPGATTKSDGGCMADFSPDDPTNLKELMASKPVWSDPSSTRSDVTALADIAKERQRQREVEGWTPEHDDTHDRGEMLTAAWCYMQRHADADMWGGNAADEINTLPAPARWPWSRAWWKPTNRRRDLVKAGALIVAEIERLDRLETHQIRRK